MATVRVRLGIEHLVMYGQEPRKFHETAIWANIGLFGTEVLPVNWYRQGAGVMRNGAEASAMTSAEI